METIQRNVRIGFHYSNAFKTITFKKVYDVCRVRELHVTPGNDPILNYLKTNAICI